VTCFLGYCTGQSAYGQFGDISYDGKWGAEGAGAVTQDKRSYSYFYSLVGAPTTDNFNNLGNNLADGVYYSNNDVTIDQNFPAGKKLVIFVNGAVRINSNIIVPTGSSLVLFANKDITIAQNVTDVQGFYLTDGMIKIEKNTVLTALGQFRGEGAFVANSFDLPRDLNVDNRNKAAETFIYRPDILVNSYPSLWRTMRNWQEVSP